MSKAIEKVLVLSNLMLCDAIVGVERAARDRRTGRERADSDFSAYNHRKQKNERKRTRFCSLYTLFLCYISSVRRARSIAVL